MQCVVDVSVESSRAPTRDLCIDLYVYCPEVKNLSDPENCNKYFVCNDSSLYSRSCNSDEKFHQNALKCLRTGQSASCAARCIRDTGYKKHIVYDLTTVQTQPVTTETTITPTTTTTATTIPLVVKTTSTSRPTTEGTTTATSQSTTQGPVTQTSVDRSTKISSPSSTDSFKSTAAATTLSSTVTMTTTAATTSASPSTTQQLTSTMRVTPTSKKPTVVNTATTPNDVNTTWSTVTSPSLTTSSGFSYTSSTPVRLTSCPPPYPCQVNAAVADPDNCGGYYVCVASSMNQSRWMSRTCQAGYRFDYIKSECLPVVDAVNCHPKCNGQYIACFKELKLV